MRQNQHFAMHRVLEAVLTDSVGQQPNNSTSNKFNPNPNRWVYQGKMTWEEMMTPFMAVLVDFKVDPPQEITATGCLTKEADRFLLKDVAVEIKPWLAPTVRNTARGPSKPSASKTVFALQNPKDLEAHVGHRIQVRGVVAPATANLPPSPETVAARGFTGVPQPTRPLGRKPSRVSRRPVWTTKMFV